MDEYTLIKGITALADNEVKDNILKEQLISRINSDRNLAFHYDVQLFVSENFRNSIIKHPVPFQLRRKLLKLLKVDHP